MTATNERRLPDGRVELVDTRRVEASPIYNHDLAPVPIARRNWSTYNYAALWISMAHCIPTYMLASGLMASGMNWSQALVTILLGNTIVLIPILLNSHPGTKYGIPFPVFARAAYGVLGSNVPALMRALVACGWFGIQAWIGGEALNTFFSAMIPGWSTLLGAGFGGHTTTAWLSFLLFWGLNIFIIYRGMDLLRHVENWAAPFVLVMTGILLWWAIDKANGLGPLLSQPGKFQTFGEFWPVFVPSLTAMIGFWATLSLNMPDFTRFGRSQREQIVGQVVALPTTMSAFAAMGVMITSATAIIYGESIWDPVQLVGKFSSPVVVAISMFTVVVATIAVNIAANVVSPANDFANAFPKFISFKTGGLITGVLGILIQPWKLLADPSGYIFTWLLGYSGGLGSIAGVLVADYWLVRRRELRLEDLYLVDGVYRGWNWRAIGATALGCALAWGGLVIPALKPLYDYAWFVGFFAAGAAHVALAPRSTAIHTEHAKLAEPIKIMKIRIIAVGVRHCRLRRGAPRRRGDVADRSAAARARGQQIRREVDAAGSRPAALRARSAAVRGERRHRHVRVGQRTHPHESSRRAGLHSHVGSGRTEQGDRRQPDRNGVHREIAGRRAAVQALQGGDRAQRERRDGRSERRRQTRHDHRRDPARAPGGAVRSRTRLHRREGRPLFLLRSRFQQRRPGAAHRLRGVQGHPAGLRAGEATGLFRRRRDEFPLPALRLGHFHPAGVSGHRRQPRRVRREARPGQTRSRSST